MESVATPVATTQVVNNMTGEVIEQPMINTMTAPVQQTGFAPVQNISNPVSMPTPTVESGVPTIQFGQVVNTKPLNLTARLNQGGKMRFSVLLKDAIPVKYHNQGTVRPCKLQLCWICPGKGCLRHKHP